MFRTLVMVLLASMASIECQVDSSGFLLPLLYSRGNCSAVPYPQTLTVYVTSQEESSRVVTVATGKATTDGLWVLQNDNVIDNVYVLTLIQLHHEAIHPFFCLNSYCDGNPTSEILMESNNVCFIKNANSGVYAYVEGDITASLVVNNIGPNFMNVYASLPLGDGSTRYYILNPAQYLQNYIQAFAVRTASDHNFTEVIITPTSGIKIYRPTELSIEVVEAYNRVILHLAFLETVWIEAEVDNCNSGVSLTGTLIESSDEIAVLSAQALCNMSSESTSNTSSTLPFSFLLNPLRQFPPVNTWGTHFIFDMYKLNTFSSDEMQYYVVSFRILSANQSSVTITCRKKGENICNSKQVIGEGEVWHYELEGKSISLTEVIIINGTGPLLVLNEVNLPNKDEIHYSELLQPTEWFTSKQVIPISYSLGSQPQQFLISLVITSTELEIKQINVWDNKDHQSPQKLDEYELIDSYSSTRVDCYTLVHIAVNSTGYNQSDYILQFELNNTDGYTSLGASIFSYGGYAFSNGYIIDNGTVLAECQIVKKDINYIELILGFFAGLLVLVAIAISLIVLWWKVGLPCFPHTRLPPPKDFEYDLFLSFADEDREFVQNVLQDALETRGYKLLLHLSGFIAGMTIEDNIIRAVKISRGVLYICSPNFNKSTYCQSELKHGLHSHYTEYKGRYRRVIPVVIGGECPTRLNTFKIRPIHTSSSVEDYNKQAINKLISALKLGKPLKATQPEVKVDGMEMS